MNDIVKTSCGKDLFASASETENKPKQIFGNFIFENELSILFGDSNAGKSILANDIAFFVSGGIGNWEGQVSPKIPALYVDMEMTQ